MFDALKLKRVDEKFYFRLVLNFTLTCKIKFGEREFSKTRVRRISKRKINYTRRRPQASRKLLPAR